MDLQGYQLDMQILPDGPKSDVDFSEILNAIQESKSRSNFKFIVKEEPLIVGRGTKARNLACHTLKNIMMF